MSSTENILEAARVWIHDKGRSTSGLRIVTDTSNFWQVDVNSVVVLEPGAYLVYGHEKEGRFGLDDQDKFWVKKAIDLATGQRKILKLDYSERFRIKIGSRVFDCYRSAQKEARLLELTRGLHHFMQGISASDAVGNNVRIVDFIPGPTFSALIDDLNLPHEEYFHRVMPHMLDLFRPCVAAVAYLHEKGEKHGDVRRDHLIYGPDNLLSWIDFDYNYQHGEYIAGLDMFGLGNILAFIVGGGDQTLRILLETNPESVDKLTPDDMNIVFPNRVMNLKLIFPHIPDSLNNILKHFTAHAHVFYDSVRELLADLDYARSELGK
ncbi:MAG: hypothetical protein HQK55_05960 [Deltaproteobacteria bacterium]|nr:hypothetical protein [Deltaproteobacteria bacterium]